jgi:hypothetical protein
MIVVEMKPILFYRWGKIRCQQTKKPLKILKELVHKSLLKTWMKAKLKEVN